VTKIGSMLRQLGREVRDGETPGGVETFRWSVSGLSRGRAGSHGTSNFEGPSPKEAPNPKRRRARQKRYGGQAETFHRNVSTKKGDRFAFARLCSALLAFPRRGRRATRQNSDRQFGSFAFPRLASAACRRLPPLAVAWRWLVVGPREGRKTY
jgi:hypothetical protein